MSSPDLPTKATVLNAGALNGFHLECVVMFDHDGGSAKGYLTDIHHTTATIGSVYLDVESLGTKTTVAYMLDEHTRVTVVP
jgi:hypothetical protein